MVKNPVPAEIKKGVVCEIRDRLDTEEAYFRAQTGSEEVWRHSISYII